MVFLGLQIRRHDRRNKVQLLREKPGNWRVLAEELDARFLSEFPEDLGKADTGVPASLWQTQEFSNQLARKNMKTFALFQCEFGAATPKPTRFLSDLDHFKGNIYEGVPDFNQDWSYKGPLPKACPHVGQHEPLIGTDRDGRWKTAPAAHYPGRLCAFLAEAIYHTWSDASFATLGIGASEASSSQGMPKNAGPSVTSGPTNFPVPESPDFSVLQAGVSGKRVEPEICDDEVVIRSGCQGPPLRASFAGRTEEFCDGMGLCSPGRWHPNLRQLERTQQQRDYCRSLAELIDRFCISKLGDLSRATMKLALGRFQTSPFSEEDMAELRAAWFKLLPDPKKAAEVPNDQPFWLFALAQSLRQMGDPDCDVIDNEPHSSFAEGVHLGHIRPLGPTPQVYRRRSKEASYDESEWSFNMDNYFKGTEDDAERILEAQFREEEAEGRMKPISEKEATKLFPGGALRIAAQGILDKPDGGHRIIHDGTHGVHLNFEIKIEDRLENPGPREMACIMETSIAAGERVIFAINADIAKAHRRVRVRPSDWGAQACKTSSNSKVIWLNKVGTFGVASAAFWWSRLMGLLGRHALNILGNDWIFILTFVDDLHIAVGGRNRWLSIWRFLVAMEMVGTPFSYKKFRGGFSVDYVGYWMDYSRFEIGISEKRSAWLISFIDKMETDGWLVLARRFQEFHGRLGFSAQVLPWLRPLLAPGYAWMAAVGKGSTLKTPELVAAVCLFIKWKLMQGLRKSPCYQSEVDLGEVFRTDAKCEEGRIVLGGCLSFGGTPPAEAAWYSLEIRPHQAPWLFRGANHESTWASTSAELLASLIAIKVFQVEKLAGPGQKSHLVRCGGGTDNKAADHLVQKRLSTKVPLMFILMDYLAHCETVGLRCQMDWRPRDANIEADDLTNQVYDKFSLDKRIHLTWEDLSFPMLDLLVSFSESFSKRKFETSDSKVSGEVARFKKSEWRWGVRWQSGFSSPPHLWPKRLHASFTN